MKRSKVVSRNSGLSRERKMHSSRKHVLHRSPEQSSRPSHSDISRTSSLSVKHRPPSGVKHAPSPPVRSPSPPPGRHPRNDSRDSASAHRRLPHKKPYELVKRRSPPPSAISHSMSSRNMTARSVTPPRSNRYQGVRGRESDQDFDSPPKKKVNRVAKRYASDHSPPHMPPPRSAQHRASSPGSQRSDHGGHRGPPHPRDFLGHDSDRPTSSHFRSQGNDRDGYRHPALEKMKQHDQSRLYMNEKSYAPTLDERFSSDSNRGPEPRIHYSRSELEKITVDIRPAVRGSSPTIRRIVNPNEVKLVRRPNEGKKPIFDREEIKQAPRDMREEAHYEHGNVSAMVTSNVSRCGISQRELGNYEITRHKFDGFYGPSSASEMLTLNDRWQKLNNKKVEPSYFDRDERPGQSYPGKLRRTDNYSDEERSPVPRPYDRDYRNDRYSQGGEPSYRRDDNAERRRSLSDTPADLRQSLASSRMKENLVDSRDHLLMRREDEPRSRWPTAPKNIMETPPGKKSMSRGSRPLSPGWDYEPELGRGNSRAEKLPSYAQRSERFKYPSWSEKQDGPSRSPTYFEPENRYSPEPKRFRSPGRPVSGRSFRSRSYRGGTRGGARGRSAFRGGNSSRGQGYSSRGMK